jgi:hypothetical protein
MSESTQTTAEDTLKSELGVGFTVINKVKGDEIHCGVPGLETLSVKVFTEPEPVLFVQLTG